MTEVSATIETVTTSGDITIKRMRVVGGWLVITTDSGLNALSTSYIPDPTWQWELES